MILGGRGRAGEQGGTWGGIQGPGGKVGGERGSAGGALALYRCEVVLRLDLPTRERADARICLLGAE